MRAETYAEPGTWLCVRSSGGRLAEVTVHGADPSGIMLELTVWD
ncbi:hypothetical protein [Myceligenerans crystallogenes]|uniref:Uncharacterized protein n=1 Tax=Myceligenerans crystallogenes TaxID=316335 RepID=A0ABN2NI31_9MICO